MGYSEYNHGYDMNDLMLKSEPITGIVGVYIKSSTIRRYM